MLHVLFDKNVSYPLRRHLRDCEVRTADDERWGQISNGDLAACAENAGYQIMPNRAVPRSFEVVEIAPPPKR